MSLLSQKNETSSFCQNHCYLIGSNAHWVIKIIPLDHYYANIDGRTSKLDYWKEKLGFWLIVLLVPENEDKIMICSFFKFSILEHFWVLKWIAWVDIRVVLIFYSFQGVRVDLEGELEKWTKYAQIWKYSKSMLLDFDSLYQWKNGSPPLYVIHIQKRLDLLFHLVCLEMVIWYENPPKISIWK